MQLSVNSKPQNCKRTKQRWEISSWASCLYEEKHSLVRFPNRVRHNRLLMAMNTSHKGNRSLRENVRKRDLQCETNSSDKTHESHRNIEGRHATGVCQFCARNLRNSLVDMNLQYFITSSPTIIDFIIFLLKRDTQKSQIG